MLLARSIPRAGFGPWDEGPISLEWIIAARSVSLSWPAGSEAGRIRVPRAPGCPSQSEKSWVRTNERFAVSANRAAGREGRRLPGGGFRAVPMLSSSRRASSAPDGVAGHRLIFRGDS